MKEFLEFASEFFELVIYCKGSEVCCSPVIDHIEEDTKYFSYRVYNNYVLFENPRYSVKYYDFLFSEGRSNNNTIIIDSDIGEFCLNIFNGIPIKPFDPAAKKADHQLPFLGKYLMKIKDVSSVCEKIGMTVKKAVFTSEHIGKHT